MHDSLYTAPFLKLNLLADRKVLSADGQDISYISIQLLDEQNNIYKGFNESVNIYVSGNATIAAIEANEQVMHWQNKSAHCFFRIGLGLVILKAGTTPEIITLTAMGRGLKPYKIKIKIRRGQK